MLLYVSHAGIKLILKRGKNISQPTVTFVFKSILMLILIELILFEITIISHYLTETLEGLQKGQSESPAL